MEEYIKCAEEPTYFIKEYVKIIHLDKGLIPFNLYDFQETMVNTFNKNRFAICKMPRQTGKSTTILSYILWYSLFNSDVTIGILANKLATARELLGRLEMSYENLPPWLQQGVTGWNKGSIELENGSRVMASATSSDSIRGYSFNLIFLDEFAFVPTHIAEDFFSSVFPTISSGETTKLLIVSTPNGMNLFYKIWNEAINKRNDYVPIEVHWSEVPGRDEAWKNSMIANTSEEQFKTEFETEFLGSSKTLISGQKLRELSYVPPEASVGKLDIYEKPKAKHIYTLVADTSHGKGMDYSAFVIIDNTESPYKVVAKYRDNEISPILYPTQIVTTAIQYNDASILCENNDVGYQVANAIHNENEYENLYVTTKRGRGGIKLSAGFSRSADFGVKTTVAVKRIGCTNLKSLIESNTLLLEDFHIIEELSAFAVHGTSWEAEQGHNDDLVMCLVLFAWLTTQDYWKELMAVDMKKMMYGEQIDDIEAELTPFGIIDDGDPEEESYLDSEGNLWHVVPEEDRWPGQNSQVSQPIYWG